MREWEPYSVKYIVPSLIRMTANGDREFSTLTAFRAIASRKDRRNRNSAARKNAPFEQDKSVETNEENLATYKQPQCMESFGI